MSAPVVGGAATVPPPPVAGVAPTGLLAAALREMTETVRGAFALAPAPPAPLRPRAAAAPHCAAGVATLGRTTGAIRNAAARARERRHLLRRLRRLSSRRQRGARRRLRRCSASGTSSRRLLARRRRPLRCPAWLLQSQPLALGCLRRAPPARQAGRWCARGGPAAGRSLYWMISDDVACCYHSTRAAGLRLALAAAHADAAATWTPAAAAVYARCSSPRSHAAPLPAAAA